MPPPNQRKAEYIVERVAANCHAIAKSLHKLAHHLLNYDDHSMLEIFRLSEALQIDIIGEDDPSPVVRIDRCAIQPYGFNFMCINAVGDTIWQHDINLIHLPGAQRLVYEFWENAPCTLTLEQITVLRRLPQYAFGEGERILAPMWRCALTRDQSVTATYIA
ncbi:hypothetical protein AURDEDRAFT_167761 [Auricularia subglabra TFB-10046 SS5]|nr:hypothetical protein AURDEDRAFT_167761 [Auricularia subglabra TFB-10046 SS5]